MKNIFVLPTDKPSRLYSYYGMLEDLSYGKTFTIANEEVTKINLHKDLKEYQENLIKANWKAENIYITSDEEIKEGEYNVPSDFSSFIDISKTSKEDLQIVNEKSNGYRKLILTDNEDLIKDGVQAIENEFLEWFVKNPSCEVVKIETFEVEDYIGFAGHTSYPTFYNEYKIIIPKEEYKQETHICKYCKAETTQSDDQCYAKPKQETLEEAVEVYANKKGDIPTTKLEDAIFKQGFIDGAKWQQGQDKKEYSKEDLREAFEQGHKSSRQLGSYNDATKQEDFEKWFENFKNK